MEFTEPTPIQSEVIPYMLAGNDCLAQAPTGTGKTFAFGIPVIEMTDLENESIQTVIMCPTRELAMQTEKELKKLTSHLKGVKILAIYGGQNFQRQLAGLRKRPQIIVGTPGRIIDHLNRKTLKFADVKTMVLDEADEMLNMGFKEDIDTILKNIKHKVQTVLFSATMPKGIIEISKNYQADPVSVKTTLNESEMPTIKQYFVTLKEKDKLEALKKIISENDYHFVLCFCNTKRKVDNLTEKLNQTGLLAKGLHGDLRQRQRDIVMRSYRNRQINILVATDVAARGIDVSDIEAVFNFDIPADNEFYVHRIGRTARAKKTGESYSFATSKDLYRIKECERYTHSEMQELKLSGLTDTSVTASKKKKSDSDSTVRFFINIGSKDGIDENNMKTFISGNTSLKDKDIVEVKVLELFSFLEIEKNESEKIFSLIGQKYKRRTISVEKANAADNEKKSFKSKGKDRFKKSTERKPKNKFTEGKFKSEKPKNKFTESRFKSEKPKNKSESEYKNKKSVKAGEKTYRKSKKTKFTGSKFKK